MDVITKNRVAKVLVMGVATLLATACQRNMLPYEPVPVEPVVVENHHVYHHAHHKCKKHCHGHHHHKAHHKAHHKGHHKGHHKNHEMSQNQTDTNQHNSTTGADSQNVAPAQ